MNIFFSNPSRTMVALNYRATMAAAIMCLTFACLSERLSAQDNFQSPQSIDGSRKDGKQDDSKKDSGPLSGAEAPSQGQQVFDVLVQELTGMFPVKFEAGSDPAKAIENAVTAFTLQDFKRAGDVLVELSAKDKNYPPADLLKAALSFAVRDAKNGQILLENAGTEHPDYPGVYTAFARLALNEGRTTDALALFEKGARLIKPSTTLSDEAKLHFEQQCLDGLIDCAMRQKKYPAARTYLERQIKSLPDNLKVLMAYAELEFQEGEIEQSLSFLQKIKAKHTEARAPEAIIAAWYDQKGDRENAAKWIADSAKKYPTDPQVQLEYAGYLVNVEDFTKASTIIADAEKSTGENLFTRNLKAKIAFCNQSFGVAEAHYKAIAEAQPDSFDPVNMYVLSMIESQDEEKRKQARDLAVRNFRALNDNVVALATLGYVQLKMGELEQAKTLLNRLAFSAGSSAEIDYFMASYWDATGEKEQAGKLLEAGLNKKGIHMYRKQAQQMLDRIKSGDGSLPAPDKVEK